MTEARRYIHSRTHLGSRLGLERISQLLERLGNPHKKLKFIHVAGTNGKGSTTTFIANILTAAGYRRLLIRFVPLSIRCRMTLPSLS